MRYEERKVITSYKWTWATLSSWKQDADPIIFTQNQEHLCTKWAILLNEKKWITIPANYRRRIHLATIISKQVTSMCRHFHHENSVKKKVCTRWSARFQLWRVVTTGSRRQHKEKNWILQRQRWSHYVLYELFKGHSRGIAVDPKINGTHSNFSALEEVLVSQRTFMWLSVCFGIWIDSGRKGER